MSKKKVVAGVQRYKTINLRTVFERMQRGLPINATMHQLYDAPEGSDLDSEFFDENCDKLELRQFLFDDYERKEKEKAEKAKAEKDSADKYKNPLEEKGGIDDEKTSNEGTSQG